MKFVKIFLIVIAVVIILISAGFFYFIKTVDVNKYVPQIASEVKKATGRGLVIGKVGIELSFSRGLVLDINGITLSDDPAFSYKPFLTIDRVSLGLSLRPLIMERKIQIGQVTITQPKVVVIRNKEGQINAASMGQRPVQQGSKSVYDEVPKEMALPILLVDDLFVSNASVTYIDQTFPEEMKVVIDKADITIKDLSLTTPFSYDLKLAAFSNEQDVEIKGRARIDLKAQSLSIEGLSVGVELGKVSIDQMTQSLAMLKPAGLKTMKGRIDVTVSDAKASSKGLEDFHGEARMKNGYIASTLCPIPVEDIKFLVKFDPKKMFIDSLTAVVAGGNVDVNGIVDQYMSLPAVVLKAKVTDLQVRNITTAYNLPVNVSGKLAAEVNTSFAGFTPDDMLVSLRGDLQAGLKEGVVEGENFLKTALGNIPMLPNLLQVVYADLPAETREDIDKGTTVIESANVTARMEGKAVTIRDANMISRDLAVSARGVVTMPDSINMNADVVMSQALSAVLTGKVSDLTALLNDEGRLYIPIMISGSVLKPQIQPDIEYLSKKLLLGRGKKELLSVIEKNPEVQGVLNSLFRGSRGSAQEQDAEVSTDASGASSESPVKEQRKKTVDALLNLISGK
jgi:uncharacterized protein involved in outer membrane biogenesis